MSVRKRTGIVDRTALQFHHASVLLLLLLAFLLNWAWLVALVAVILLTGTLWPRAGLFKQIYLCLLKPAGLLHPRPRLAKPHPHLFAQGLEGLLLAVVAAALLSGAELTGWLLNSAVLLMAATDLFADFCLGRFLYYQLVRRGIDLNLAIWRGAE